jgi:hypothetical protein
MRFKINSHNNKTKITSFLTLDNKFKIKVIFKTILTTMMVT